MFKLFICYCRLLINFAYRLDKDQVRQNFGPDLDPICFDIQMVILKVFFEKVDLEKSRQTTK